MNLVTRFTGLYQSETLVDVTLAAEGKHLQAHKMILSACSDYFHSLFGVNPCQHPIVILKDVTFEDLQVIVQFMYNGIVNVSSEKLPDILKVFFSDHFKSFFSVTILSSQCLDRAPSESRQSTYKLMSSLCTMALSTFTLSSEKLPNILKARIFFRVASLRITIGCWHGLTPNNE